MSWLNISDNTSDLFYLASKESSFADPEYRYKILNPIISITGKKGNRTTWFENSEYYSEKFGVPSLYFGKYIGYKISCPSSFDKEKNCIGWKGEYTKNQIENYLKEFIKIYILCPNCDYPETDLFLENKKFISTLCRSCGNSFIIQSKHMDKTYDFILKSLEKTTKN